MVHSLGMYVTLCVYMFYMYILKHYYLEKKCQKIKKAIWVKTNRWNWVLSKFINLIKSKLIFKKKNLKKCCTFNWIIHNNFVPALIY